MDRMFPQDDIVRDGHLVKDRFEFYGTDTVEVNRVIHSGTAQAGGANTLTLATSASGVDDAYAGMGISIKAGTGVSQDHLRIDSYNGTTKVATLTGDWVTAPDTTSVYKIIDRYG